jgi:TrmH family RNA methyltransferase
MTAPVSSAARIRSLREDPEIVVLDGFHALKHALRFGADVKLALATDLMALTELARELAPDLTDKLAAIVQRADRGSIELAAGHLPATGVVALARRPDVLLAGVLADPRPRPLVLLENPRHAGNLGAVIRVAAAADAAGVLSTGTLDPWQPAAVRGAAGLHFALPVARIPELPLSDRPLVAFDPSGDPLASVSLPDRPVLAFGGERHGLPPGLLEAAKMRVAVPMRAGVSSLNLATAVAVVLYHRVVRYS